MRYHWAMGSPSLSRGLALLGALALGACFPPQLPPGVLISCSETSDCPTGFVCNLASQLCVDPDLLDSVAPGIVDIVMPPGPLKAGAALPVSFTATEALLVDPVVEVSVGADAPIPLPLVEAETDRAALRYAFSIAVPPGASEGAAIVRANLIDAGGNTVTGIEVGRVLFDFTPPSIVGSASLELRAPPGCPLGAVTAAGDEAQVLIGFVASEPLAAAPLVTVNGGVALRLESSAGLGFRFALDVDANVPEGSHGVAVVLTDEAGNESAPLALELPAPLLVDRTAPDLSAALPLLRHVRQPWGSLEDGPSPSFFVEADAPLLGLANATLRFVDGGDEAAVEIGRAIVGAVGALPRTPLSADRTTLFARALDEACNASAALPLGRQVFTVTSARKIAGSVNENPHRFEARAVLGPQLEVPIRLGAAVELDGAALASIDGVGVTVEPAARLRPLVVDREPASVLQSSLAWDPVHDRVVMLTDDPGNQPKTQTRLWDGARWLKAAPSDPEGDGDPLIGAELGEVVFDGWRSVVVLVRPTGEHWEWNGTSWRARPPVPVGFAPAKGMRLAFDDERGVVIAVRCVPAVTSGGALGLENHTCSSFGSMFLWDGISWSTRVGLPGPGDRFHPGLAFDPLSRRVLLRGGYRRESVFFGVGVPDQYLDDQWEWDGDSWTQVEGGPGPRGPLDALASFDGVFAAEHDTGGSWAWDGAAWTPLAIESAVRGRRATWRAAHDDVLFFGAAVSPSPVRTLTGTPAGPFRPALPALLAQEAGPPGVGCYAMTYDERRGRAVMLCQSAAQEVWEHDGEQWAFMPASGQVPTNTLVALGYDAVGETVVALQQNGNGAFFRWDGSTWTRSAGSDPEGDGNPASGLGTTGGFVYDESRDAVLLLANGGTWRFTGQSFARLAADDVRLADCASPQFLALLGGPVALCADRQGGFSSSSVSRTFVLGAAVWDELVPTDVEGDGDPPPTTLLAADAVRDQLVAFVERFLDTPQIWSFDGARWQNITPLSPLPLENMRAAFAAGDAGRGRVLIFDASTSRTMVFEGTTLREVEVPPAPGARGGAVLAATNRGDEVLLFGGANARGLTNDVWRFDGTRFFPVETQGQAPAPRAFAAGAWDGARLVVHGGRGASGALDDTWALADDGTWTLLSSSGPGARAEHAMVLEPQSGALVMLGGAVDASAAARAASVFTLEPGGVAWEEHPAGASSPGPRASALVGVQGGEVLLYGGRQGGIDTSDFWAWSPVTRSFRALPDGSQGPGRRRGGAFVTAADGALLMVGGRSAGTAIDVWRLTEQGFIPIAVDDADDDGAPDTPLTAAAPLTSSGRVLLLIDGRRSDGPDTWILDDGSAVRPGVVMSIEVAAAGLGEARPEEVTVLAAGSGSGGLALAGWSALGFRTLAVASGAIDVIDATVTGRGEIALLGVGGKIRLAVSPLEPGAIDVDAVEVRLTFLRGP
jgi:hypothetical protein